MEDRIEIGEYDPNLRKIFAKYVKIITKAFPKAKVELFGSVAVPMKGKKDELDILVIVPDQNKALPLFKKLFSKCEVWDDRIYLYDYRFKVEAEIHLVSEGHEKIQRVRHMVHLLQTNPVFRKELEALKDRSVGVTKEEYRQRKTKFLIKHKLIKP